MDPTEKLFGEEIAESIQNEAGMRTINWGPVRKNINFINEKPALIPEQADGAKTSQQAEYGDDNSSDRSGKSVEEPPQSKKE